MSSPSRVEAVTLQDLEVAFRCEGKGRRVVFIHGLAQDHRMWRRQQEELTRFETLAYDVRGHGRTPLGAADGTLAQLGGDLVAFLDRFGSATCVGHSLGGTIALWAAAERPDLVDSVVASATSSVVGRAAAGFYAERIQLFSSGDDEQLAAALLEDTRAQLHRPLDAEALVAYRLETIADRGGYLNGARAMAALHDQPLNDRLEQIRCPVLVVAGEHDAFCPHRAVEIMLEHLPGGEHRSIPGVGHLPTDEDPAAVTAVINSGSKPGRERPAAERQANANGDLCLTSTSASRKS
jgi:pimeloyl-ACP methyl ester carboxylesterase